MRCADEKDFRVFGVGRCPWGVPHIYIHAYTFWGENGCKPVRAAALKIFKGSPVDFMLGALGIPYIIKGNHGDSRVSQREIMGRLGIP